MTLPEMALRFILSHPAVSTTIAGMRKLGERSPEHRRQ
jgi:aryl-alcohol dehydrogenase-like predicted oxidoreductase